MSSGININLTFPRHPKTLILIELAGEYAPWHLVLLWIFAGEFYPKGEIPKKVDLEYRAGWKGEKGRFLDAILRAGYLSENKAEGTFVLHDWKDHNAWIYFKDKRSQAARRAVEARWRKRLDATEGNMDPDDTVQDPPVQQEGKEIDLESLMPTLRPCPKITGAVQGMTDDEYFSWVKFVYNRMIDGADDVAKRKIAEWGVAFPTLDVYLELNRACEWLLDHPHQKRTHLFQYYGNWMRNQVSDKRSWKKGK